MLNDLVRRVNESEKHFLAASNDVVWDLTTAQLVDLLNESGSIRYKATATRLATHESGEKPLSERDLKENMASARTMVASMVSQEIRNQQ